MRKTRVLVFVLAATTVSSIYGAISRAELVDMANNHVDHKVMLALVQRDCIDFDITPSTAVELSKTISADILNGYRMSSTWQTASRASAIPGFHFSDCIAIRALANAYVGHFLPQPRKNTRAPDWGDQV